MIKELKKIVYMAISALVLFSCAVEKDESERSVQQRILDAFVDVNYPNAKRLESGLVIISSQEGTGDTLNKYEAGFFEYSIRDLNFTYSKTTDEELAKVLGTFANSNYYGPQLFELGYESIYAGLEEAMYKMREGGKISFILPPWLTYTTSEKMLNLSVSTIYEMELKEVVGNMLIWQQDTMKAYTNTHYPGLDTLKSNFYFKKLVDAGGDTLKNESANVYYIGRLLDGWVFDTNIADTAKKYGIYDSSKDYSPLEVIYNEDLTQMKDDNSLVEGFCMALKEMSFGDVAFTMFYSEYGYGSTGSDQIGPYQPLIFWLDVREKE